MCLVNGSADSLDSGLARARSAEFIKDRAVGAVVAFAGGDQAANQLNDAPSLGEHGLYLHGAPYAFAPEEQIKVPYLIWMSEGYRQRYSVDDKCLQAQRHGFLTHNTVYGTHSTGTSSISLGPAGQSIRFSSADGLILLKYIKRVTRYLFDWHQSFTNAWNSHR